MNRLDALSAFAVVLRSDSDSVSFNEAEEVSDEPRNDVDALEGWLKQQVETGAFCAVAVCAPCEIKMDDGVPSVRALYAGFEHRSGEAADVYVPFEKRDTYEYQEEIVLERSPAFFPIREEPPTAEPTPVP